MSSKKKIEKKIRLRNEIFRSKLLFQQAYLSNNPCICPVLIPKPLGQSKMFTWKRSGSNQNYQDKNDFGKAALSLFGKAALSLNWVQILWPCLCDISYWPVVTSVSCGSIFNETDVTTGQSVSLKIEPHTVVIHYCVWFDF